MEHAVAATSVAYSGASTRGADSRERSPSTGQAGHSPVIRPYQAPGQQSPLLHSSTTQAPRSPAMSPMRNGEPAREGAAGRASPQFPPVQAAGSSQPVRAIPKLSRLSSSQSLQEAYRSMSPNSISSAGSTSSSSPPQNETAHGAYPSVTPAQSVVRPIPKLSRLSSSQSLKEAYRTISPRTVSTDAQVDDFNVSGGGRRAGEERAGSASAAARPMPKLSRLSSSPSMQEALRLVSPTPPPADESAQSDERDAMPSGANSQAAGNSAESRDAKGENVKSTDVKAKDDTPVSSSAKAPPKLSRLASSKSLKEAYSAMGRRLSTVTEETASDGGDSESCASPPHSHAMQAKDAPAVQSTGRTPPLGRILAVATPPAVPTQAMVDSNRIREPSSAPPVRRGSRYSSHAESSPVGSSRSTASADAQTYRPSLRSDSSTRHLPDLSSQVSGQRMDAVKRVFRSLDPRKTGVCRLSDLERLLATFGIRQGHPGLTELRRLCSDAVSITFGDFANLLLRSDNILRRCLEGEVAVVDFFHFCEEVVDIAEALRSYPVARNCAFIPQMLSVDPDLFSVSICTVDGQTFSYGDTKATFAWQGTMNAFLYAYLCTQLGTDRVHEVVTNEPVGGFRAELSVEHASQTLNPLLNSGALAMCGLMTTLGSEDAGLGDILQDFVNFVKEMSAHRHPITFNQPIYLGEMDHSENNHALAHHMRSLGKFPRHAVVKDVLELYVQLQSMEISAACLADIGAVLSSGGIQPLSGKRLIEPEIVRNLLALMYGAGLYSYSGIYMFTVGCPSKSGMSGNIIMVVPSVMSIAVYSPPVDASGNSMRGVAFAKGLSDRFGLSIFDQLVLGVTVGAEFTTRTACAPSIVEHFPGYRCYLSTLSSSEAPRVQFADDDDHVRVNFDPWQPPSTPVD